MSAPLLRFALSYTLKKGLKRARPNASKKRRLEIEERGKKLDEIKNWGISYGINQNLKYYKGRKKPVRVSQAFLWGEFGTRNQPARPAVSDHWKRKKKKYDSAYNTMVAVYLLPRYKSGQWPSRLKNYGRRIIFDIKNAIQAYQKIGNAEATIAKKGFNNPLIDTRKMQNAWKSLVYRRGNQKTATRYFLTLATIMERSIAKTNATQR